MKFGNLHARLASWNTKNKYSMFFMRYFMYLYGLAITRFRWYGLPDEIPPRYLEDLLFTQGKALFFYEDAADLYAVTAVNLGGTIDNYQVPDTRWAYALHYYGEYRKDNSVIIWDNNSNYPTIDLMLMHADALANMRMTRDINIYAMRHPVIMTGPEKYRLTLNNVAKQYNDFAPYIGLKEGMVDLDKIKVLDLKAPIVFPEIDIEIKQEIAWALTELGISSSSNFKRERVNTQEATGNMGEMEMARHAALDVRQRAAEQINRMFGLNVRVEFNSEIEIPGIMAEVSTDFQPSDSDEGGEVVE